MANNTTGEFGRRLRVLRDAAGLSQTQLAEKLGIPQPNLSRLERGGREDPAWSTVCSLALALGVSTEEFWPRTGRGKNSKKISERT